MRAVKIYRVDYGRKTKDTIVVVPERRKKERANHYSDLLQLARGLFALDTADSIRVIIEGGQPPGAIILELTGKGPGTARRGRFEDTVSSISSAAAGGRNALQRFAT